MKGYWLAEPTDGTAVIFVHGVLSSGDACWKNENGAYWPELVRRNHDLQGLGVYVYTYQTGIFSGDYSLSDVTADLWERMKLDGAVRCRRLIFVCHSMGGIVVRRLLVTRDVQLIESKTDVGVFLVASPSLGSKYANLLGPLAKLMGHAQQDALRFSTNNYWLNDLDKEFLTLRDSGKLKIKGRELIEDKFVTLKRFWRDKVVPAVSGYRYFGEPLKIALSDHMSIAKPADEKALQHRALCEFIAEMLPAPIDVTGEWRLNDDHNIYWARLEQTGKAVTGEYRLNTGDVGTLKGRVVDETLELEWTQAFNKKGGNATVKISEDRRTMDGHWDYDPARCAVPQVRGLYTWTFVRLPGGRPGPPAGPPGGIERYATRALTESRGPLSPAAKYRVVGFDLDGTLLRGLKYSWAAVWKHLQFDHEVRHAGMKRYLSREITYQQWCDWCVQQFRPKGLKRADFSAIGATLTLTQNLREAVRLLRSNGLIVAIISGGIDTLLREAMPDAEDLFDYISINKLHFDDMGVISRIDATPYDFEGKATALESICRQHGATMTQAVFVGDGANDAEALKRAGLSIAYPPKEQGVEDASTISIEQDDLMQIMKHII